MAHTIYEEIDGYLIKQSKYDGVKVLNSNNLTDTLK